MEAGNDSSPPYLLTREDTMNEAYTMNWEEYERVNGPLKDMTINDMTIELQNFIKEQEMKTQNDQFKIDMGLTNDEERLLALADDMAAAMSDLNPQNYKEFVDARDRFRKVIAEIVNKTKQNEARIAKMKEAILAA